MKKVRTMHIEHFVDGEVVEGLSHEFGLVSLAVIGGRTHIVMLCGEHCPSIRQARDRVMGLRKEANALEAAADYWEGME